MIVKDSLAFRLPPGRSTRSGLNGNKQSLRLGLTTLVDDQETIEKVRDDLLNRIATAVSLDGPRALVNPRSAAIWHESGHVVVHTYFGDPVDRCKVWRCKNGADYGQWIGMTWAGDEWKADASTTPEDDFRRACRVMAGVIAEFMFDRANFRRGSSLDEGMVANMLATNIAVKTGRDIREVWLEITRTTMSILRINADVVRDVATLLGRRKVLRKKALAPLLERVSKIAPGLKALKDEKRCCVGEQSRCQE